MIDKSARELARNPLGIVALFIVLVYGIAALALGLTSSLTVDERTPIVWFLVTFPVLVLGVFGWLVSQHHQKLYAPGDYKSDAGFLSAAQARNRHVAELQAQQENLQAKVRETLTKAAPDGVSVEQVIGQIEAEIERATTLTVDASGFTGAKPDRWVYPIGAFDTVDALANEVYFRLNPRVQPYEYGYSWILRNSATGEVVKTARVITGAPRGQPLADRRTLQELGIAAGTTLLVERP